MAVNPSRVEFKLSKPHAPTRRIIFPDPPAWPALAAKAAGLYELPVDAVALSYIDSDGDDITLNTEEELQQYYTDTLTPDHRNIKFTVGSLTVESHERDIVSEPPLGSSAAPFAATDVEMDWARDELALRGVDSVAGGKVLGAFEGMLRAFGGRGPPHHRMPPHFRGPPHHRFHGPHHGPPHEPPHHFGPPRGPHGPFHGPPPHHFGRHGPSLPPGDPYGGFDHFGPPPLHPHRGPPPPRFYPRPTYPPPPDMDRFHEHASPDMYRQAAQSPTLPTASSSENVGRAAILPASGPEPGPSSFSPRMGSPGPSCVPGQELREHAYSPQQPLASPTSPRPDSHFSYSVGSASERASPAPSAGRSPSFSRAPALASSHSRSPSTEQPHMPPLRQRSRSPTPEGSPQAPPPPPYPHHGWGHPHPPPPPPHFHPQHRPPPPPSFYWYGVEQG